MMVPDPSLLRLMAPSTGTGMFNIPRPGGITADHLRSQQLDWMTNMAGRGGLFANLFRKLLAGRVSGGTGMRGPERSPFAGLARFAGPFGNGGGPMVPSFGNLAGLRWHPRMR